MANWRLTGMLLAASVFTAGLENPSLSNTAEIMLGKISEPQCWPACAASPPQFDYFGDGALIQVYNSEEVRKIIEKLKEYYQNNKSAELFPNSHSSSPVEGSRHYAASLVGTMDTAYSVDEIAPSWYDGSESLASVQCAYRALNMNCGTYELCEMSAPYVLEPLIGKAGLVKTPISADFTRRNHIHDHGLAEFAAAPAENGWVDWVQAVKSIELNRVKYGDIPTLMASTKAEVLDFEAGLITHEVAEVLFEVAGGQAQLAAAFPGHGDMKPAWEGAVGTVETAPDAWNCEREDGESIMFIPWAKVEFIDSLKFLAVRGLTSD